ncbi:hypothetical protein C8R44DRAFT_254672 [Mycena epipterygia]|nr:hypothetical protein C8R44DRAFT_254672 [Mycena epipterygia]
MQLGQFSAVVTVDGVELSEFAVEYSADATEATCWIASEEDKQFRIEWKDDQASASREISGLVTVDGIDCGGKRMMIQGRSRHVSTAFRDSVPTSATTRRPLLFSKQALTDDDDYLNTAISPQLGTIQLLIRHVRDSRKRPSSYRGPTFQPQILHERSKKAIGHSVQFGTEFNSTDRNQRRHPHIVKSLVTFVFKYRPIGLLRAEGIAPPEVRVPRTVSPADVLDLTMDVDEEDADDAEIKKLEARLSALKNKKTKVKLEPCDVKKEIKSEEPIFKPGEVIDLT